MTYQLRDTARGVEVLRLTPQVVAHFAERAMAEAFLEFLDLGGGPDADPDPDPDEAEAPAPSPVPEVAAAPEQEAAAVEVDPEDWTEADLAGAFARLARKERVKDVAADYGKSWTALRGRWAAEMSARRQGAARAASKPVAPKPEVKPARAETPKGTPEPGPVIAPPAPAAGMSGFVVDLDKAQGAEKLLRMHLRAVGYAAPWTPALDLQLVEGLARGDGLGATAAGMQMPLDACRARWQALLPEVTLDGQARLLATLKALVAENGAQAA